MEFIHLLFWLTVAHALCDYPLQGYLAELKNNNSVVIDEKYAWVFGLFFHSIIHAGAVAFLTQSVVATIIKFVVHFITDYVKCQKKISFCFDQIIHILTKVIICIVVLY